MRAIIRLRDHGANREELCLAYVLRVRSILEYACPAWGSLISAKQSDRIEAIQRQALNLILGSEASSYKKNLEKLNQTTLKQRRLELTRTFAIKAFKDPRFTKWFQKSPSPLRPIRKPLTRFILPKTRLSVTASSPIIYYTQLLNCMSDEELGMQVTGCLL